MQTAELTGLGPTTQEETTEGFGKQEATSEFDIQQRLKVAGKRDLQIGAWARADGSRMTAEEYTA